jgi:hypothetical protein
MDYSQLSDPELLAEAERIRGELEHVPLTLAKRVELGSAYGAVGEEYDRRRAPRMDGH